MWTLAAVIADFILTTLVWCVAVVLRGRFNVANAPEFIPYLKFGILLSSITMFWFSRVGLYSTLNFRSRTKNLLAILRANCVAFLAFILIAYFLSEVRISRGTLLIYFPLSCLALALERHILRTLLVATGGLEKMSNQVILVGNGEPLKSYIQIVRENPYSGIRFTGWWDPPTDCESMQIPTLKTDIIGLRTHHQPNAYVVSYASDQSEKIDEFLRLATNEVTKVFVLPNLTSYALLGLTLEDFSGLPVLALNQPRFSMWELVLKRTVDLIGSGLGLILISPFLGLIALAVKLSSPGPILFRQERMGLDGSTFHMLKFRTMKIGPAQPGWTIANDPRRTKVGSFLRSTSLDELPQLWNVFIGEMSLVGPRPEQPYYVESFRQDIPAYMLRHKMKAGITGWAQVNGWRGDTSLHKRIECDLYYIRNWSFLFDIKILFLTFWKGFINRNAY